MMKEITTSQRLKQLMFSRKLRQVDILDLVEATIKRENIVDVKISKTDLSQYVNGKVEPGQKKLYLLAKALEVNEAWLLGLDADMVRKGKDIDAKTDDINIVYKALNSDRKVVVYNFAQEQLAEQRSNVVDSRDYRDVTLQSVVSAGSGIVDLEPEYKEIISYSGYIPEKYDMAFIIKGYSMEPLFEDGELIFVKAESEVRNGQIGVVMIDGEAYIKKMYLENGKQIRLVSLNRKYEDMIFDGKNDIRVIGRIIL